MSTITLNIPGLPATATTSHIEKALEAVPGVTSVRIESSEGKAIVEHEGAEVPLLLNALRAVGHAGVQVEA